MSFHLNFQFVGKEYEVGNRYYQQTKHHPGVLRKKKLSLDAVPTYIIKNPTLWVSFLC